MEITSALSQLPGLRVAARSSAFALRESADGPRRIARQLSVKSLFEGSVRRAGTRIMVTARLIDPETVTCLWSEEYAFAATDVFSVQRAMTSLIA